MPPTDNSLMPDMQRFFIAAAAGDTPAVRAVIANNKEALAWRDAEGKTALMIAAARGDTQLGNFLLEAGAYVDSANTNQTTSLTLAAAAGRTEFVRLLVSYGANINRRNTKGTTPLIAAAYNGHTEVAQFLVDSAGADPTLLDSSGLGARQHALQNGHTALADWLAKAEQALASDKTLFFNAIYADDVTRLQSLLKRRPAATVWQNEKGMTGLMCAAINGQDVVARLLLAEKASADAVNANGSTALMMAAAAGHVPLIDVLLATNASHQRADINRRNAKGATALMAAAWSGQKEAALRLLENYGADATLRDSQNLSAADHATAVGLHELARTLASRAETQAKEQKEKSVSAKDAQELISPALRDFAEQAKTGEFKTKKPPAPPKSPADVDEPEVSPAMRRFADELKKGKLF